MLFGSNNEQGLRLNLKTLQLEVVQLGDPGVSEKDIVLHDETNATLAGLLARLAHPVALVSRREYPAYVSATNRGSTPLWRDESVASLV